MQKRVHDCETGKTVWVDLTAEDVADAEERATEAEASGGIG